MSRSVLLRKSVLVVWVTILFVWGLDTHGNWAGTGDEPHYAMIAHSLVFDRDFDLANDYAEPGNLVNRGGGPQDPGAHVRIGRNNIVRPVHDVGLPIIAAPYFAVAWTMTRCVTSIVPQRVLSRGRLDPPLLFRHFLSFGMIIVTALMARRFFRLMSAAGSSRDALLWTLLIVLSPPILSHSFLFFTELPAAAIATWLYTTLTSAERKQANVARVQDVLIGAAIGFLPLLHVRLSGLALGFVLLCVWRRGFAWRPLVALFAPMIALVAFKLWLNELFWGTLLTSPHVRIAASDGLVTQLTVAAERIVALCFDQAHGLLTYAPLYLTVLPGTMFLWRTNRRQCAELLLLVACYLVPVALPTLNVHGWEAGWSPAARFLVPVIPFLALLAFSCVSVPSRWSWGVRLLVAIQVALDALYWSHPKILWNDVGAPSALLRFVSPTGRDLSTWFPAWSQPSPYTVTLTVVLLVAWIAASALVVRNWNARKGCPVAST